MVEGFLFFESEGYSLMFQYRGNQKMFRFTGEKGALLFSFRPVKGIERDIRI